MHSQNYLLLCVNAGTSFCAHVQHLRQCISARVVIALTCGFGCGLAVHMLLPYSPPPYPPPPPTLLSSPLQTPLTPPQSVLPSFDMAQLL